MVIKMSELEDFEGWDQPPDYKSEENEAQGGSRASSLSCLLCLCSSCAAVLRGLIDVLLGTVYREKGKNSSLLRNSTSD